MVHNYDYSKGLALYMPSALAYLHNHRRLQYLIPIQLHSDFSTPPAFSRTTPIQKTNPSLVNKQFYRGITMPMDRHSSRYFDYVESRWAELPAVKPDDAEIPATILKSWQRCVDQGLNPRQARLAADFLLMQQDPSGSAKGGVMRFEDGHVFCMRDDTTRAVISMFAVADGQRQSLSMAEECVGTNAVDLACRLKRDVFVNGPEHYAQSLHDCYTYAAPIFDAQQQICCICCVCSDNADTTQEMSQFVRILASFGNGIHRMEHGDLTHTLFTIPLLDNLPFGVIYVDHSNVIKYFNQSISEIFSFKKGMGTSASLEPYIITLCNALSFGQHDVHVRYGNNKKEVNITSFPLSDSGYEKIYLVEDRTPTKVPVNQQAKYTFDDIKTMDPHMIQAKIRAATVAVHNVPVMLVGESGVGKEMFAQSIHNASSRRDGPFIALNTSAIVPSLVESTLFGYEKGAFTGASKEGKTGYFEAASGGTLFLDELDSIPHNVQTKLLRAISSRTIRRVGGTEDIPIDVRLISAGRVDVLELTQDQTFREDLYYRLSPIKLHIPNLASRQSDIPFLTRFFLEQESILLNIPCPTPTEEFISCLKRYSWPGNVRELINILRQTLVFLEPDKSTLEADMLPEHLLQDMRGQSVRHENVEADDESMLKLAGIVAVCMSLKSGLYNVESISRHLGLSTSTVYNYITKGKQYGLL